MGNEHEKLTKESNKMKKKALKNKGKNNKAIESDEEDSDGEKNNNNEKERQLNEYDKEMSKILFEEEYDLDESEKLKKNKKKDKKSELRSYAQEIAEEQFMEDINRSKSFNREARRRGYKNNNGNDSDDYNEFKKSKERKKKKKENENGRKKVNNINIQVNDDKDDIKNSKKRNISINKKRTISNDNLNINHELEKNLKKRKVEANKNLSKTTANDLFGPSKKKEGKEKDENPNKNYKTKNSSPRVGVGLECKTLKSTSVNINEKNLDEDKNNNKTCRKPVISKSIYSKVEPEDLRIVLLYMKNGNNKYQEGLDLCGKRKYLEAQSCFNYARNSYITLSKLMNGNPKAYPSEFRIVISQKINEKLQLVYQSIRECNEFIKKNEIIIKKPEKAQDILRNNNKNINRKNSNNNFNQINNFNNNMNNNNLHNNYRNYNNNNLPNNNKNIHGNEDDEMDEKIESEIMIKNPGVKFNDIIGMKEMKRILYEIIVVPTIRPDLFTGIRKPQRGILLFGPPGTGKTMIAKAIASECNSTFFNISASSLTSKWVGESEKTVKSLFKLAYKKVPSIIFIDEIDSILSKRSENENEATKRLKTEFLIQFDGLGSNTNARLLVIAATNRPMDLDEALLRRLPKRVYCGPLDEEGRFEFIKKVINRVETKLTDKDIKEVAKMTNGYSNSDLKELCKEAAFQPVRELTMDQIMRINKFRPLVKKDLVKSVQKIRGSLSNKVIDELLKWNKQFGGI